MILLLHIATALISIVVTTYALIRPTTRGLNVGYGLAAFTLVSGTILVFSSGSNLLRSCITGITYFALVAIGLSVVKRRLAEQTIDK